MTDTPLEPEENIDNLEPPEVKLTAPNLSEVSETWLVVAKNRKVNKAWEALMQRSPENTTRCYQDLCTAPMTQKPRRVFPLKGKKYEGIWEYEVTSGDRVFYIPDEMQKKVLVFYAGKHIKPAPTP
jgi:hypothetical protein